MKLYLILSKRLIAAVLSSILLITGLFLGGEAQAASLEESLVQSGKTFLSSVVNEYTKSTQDNFDGQFKDVQKTIKELSGELKRAANPALKPEEREKLFKKIASSKNELQKAATSFEGLAQQTDKFGNQLEGSVQDLLATVQNQVKDKLSGNRSTFEETSKAISAIVDDISSVNETNVLDFISQVGNHIQDLNQTAASASKVIKSFAS
jgi:gas vesicle protein